MEHFSVVIYGFLVIAGCIAGIVDTIAGDGGLITVTVLLALGFSPVYALGINKLQEPIGQIVATQRFLKTGQIHFRPIMILAIFSIAGTSIGALLIQIVRGCWLQKIIPLLLMLILLYSVFSGRLFSKRDEHGMHFSSFALLFGLLIGFYNGFFGPGTGSL